MTNRDVRVLAVLVGVIVGVLLVSPTESKAQSGETGNHHLLWDPTDMLWRCLGSPMDCTSAAE